MPQLSAIILAGGLSTRMTDGNKLLLPFGEHTVLETVVSAVLKAELFEVIVVTGFEDRKVREVLAPYPVRVVYNPEYATGLASSLRRGVLAASPATRGYMICLGDMPLIRTETYRQLQEAFASRTGPTIFPVRYDGRRGNPVVFDRAYHDEILRLTGDEGARSILLRHAEEVQEVDVTDPGIHQDIDTHSTYEAMRQAAHV